MADGVIDTFLKAAAPPSYPQEVAVPFARSAKNWVEAPKTNPDNFNQAAAGALAGKSQFTLAQSKTMILASLEKYPELHERAKKIFDAGFDRAVRNGKEAKIRWGKDQSYIPGRWRLQEVAPGKARMMQCRSAGEAEIKKNPDDANQFYTPGNRKNVAVIDYQFDGSMNGVIYMAHELGHAIADDTMREAGHSAKTNPQHVKEMQAYLVQNIVSDHLQNDTVDTDPKAKPPKAVIAAAARDSRLTEMRGYMDGLAKSGGIVEEDSRPVNILTAAGLAERLKTMSPADQATTIRNVHGGNGPMGIQQILQEAGVTDTDAFAQETVFREADGGEPEERMTQNAMTCGRAKPIERGLDAAGAP